MWRLDVVRRTGERGAVRVGHPIEEAIGGGFGRRVSTRWRVVAAGAAALVAVVVTVFELERTVADRRSVDAHLIAVGADRVGRVGESFFVGFADHKGPLWLAVYRTAQFVAPSASSYWFVIAAMALIVAAVTGLAMSVVLRHAGVGRPVASAAGCAIALYLALGPDQYSDVLYSRNITTLLLAGGFAVSTSIATAPPAVLGHRCLIAGALAGLAVQTVPSEVLAGTAIVLAGPLIAAVRPDVERPRARRLALMATGAAVTIGSSAPLWYALRGDFDEFWTLYWTGNLRYGEASDRSTLEVVRHGASEVATYLADRPLFASAGLAFVATTLWRRQELSGTEVAARTGLAAWWAGAALGLVAAQRFFEHYWVAIVVPLLAMGALAIGDAIARLPRRRITLATIPLVLVAVTVVPRAVSGGALAAGFRGFDEHREEWLLGEVDHATLSQRAIAATYTHPDDAVLLWSRNAWAQLIIDRPAATRYLVDSWFTGIVPGARKAVSVLPDVWRNFSADIEESDPRLVIVQHRNEVPASSPFEDLLTDRYVAIGTLTYSAELEPDATIHLRTDLVGAGLRAPDIPPTGRGLADEIRLEPGDVMPTGVGSCAVLTVRVDRPDAGSLVVIADDAGTEIHLAAHGETVIEGIEVARTLAPITGETLDLTIATSTDGVVVLGDGQIIGAVTVAAADLEVAIAARGTDGAITFTDPEVSDAASCRD